MIFFVFILLSIYISMLIIFLVSANKMQELKIEKSLGNFQKFSIIIPFKNESSNLPTLLKSLKKIKYKKNNFEIIFIDDNSTDNGKEIIRKFTDTLPITLLNNNRKSNSPKKDALEAGIKQAKYDFIITTDADCMLPEKLLLSYNQLIQEKKVKMIIAPVKYFDNDDFFSQFQSIEFLTLQGFTKGACALNYPFLSNGANFGFDKKSFIELGAYSGNNQIASGDDTFILEKFRKKYPDEIYFLNTSFAIVKTLAQPNLKSLKNQKIRWASKSKKQSFGLSTFIGLIIVLANYVNILLWILIFQNTFLSISFILTKALADIGFVLTINRFYKNKIKFHNYLLTSIFYPFYVFWIFLWSITGKFEWKGNNYKA